VIIRVDGDTDPCVLLRLRHFVPLMRDWVHADA
jgi:hypothetical protein